MNISKDKIINNSLIVNNNIVPVYNILPTIKRVGAIIFNTAANGFYGFTKNGWINITDSGATENIAQVLSNGPNPGDAGGQPLFNLSKLIFDNGTSVRLGSGAGESGQSTYSAVAIGNLAGNNNQESYSIAIGNGAGQNNQGITNDIFFGALAIGSNAGQNDQGNGAVAIGANAGQYNQTPLALAVGTNAGHTGQGESAIAIGAEAGRTGQGSSAIAIGAEAGSTGQGGSAIAIGYKAAKSGQGANSIVINATGSELIGPIDSGACYIAPIRGDSVTTQKALYYNINTKEVFYNSA